MYYVQATLDGNSYCTTSDFISIGSSGETNALLIKNPTGSGKIMVICQAALGTNATVLTEGRNFLRVYRGPTVTNDGTELTASNMRPGSANTAVCKVYKNPTTSAKGTAFVVRSFLFKAHSDDVKQVGFLDPGQSWLVTCEGSASNNVHFDVNWLEIV